VSARWLDGIQAGGNAAVEAVTEMAARLAATTKVTEKKLARKLAKQDMAPANARTRVERAASAIRGHLQDLKQLYKDLIDAWASTLPAMSVSAEDEGRLRKSIEQARTFDQADEDEQRLNNFLGFASLATAKGSKQIREGLHLWTTPREVLLDPRVVPLLTTLPSSSATLTLTIRKHKTFDNNVVNVLVASGEAVVLVRGDDAATPPSRPSSLWIARAALAARAHASATTTILWFSSTHAVRWQFRNEAFSDKEGLLDKPAKLHAPRSTGNAPLFSTAQAVVKALRPLANHMLVFQLGSTSGSTLEEVGLFFTGASVPEELLRTMIGDVIAMAEEHGGRVVAVSFDGEHHALLKRDKRGKPLLLTEYFRQNAHAHMNDIAKKGPAEVLSELVARGQVVPDNAPVSEQRGLLLLMACSDAAAADGFPGGEWFKADDNGTFMCEDVPHVLKRWRSALLHSKGAFFGGADKEHFFEVARSKRTPLTEAIMFGADMQNVRNARITFSDLVERELKAAGHHDSAKLCQVVRQWFNAFDARGVTEADRDAAVANMAHFLTEVFKLAFIRHHAQARGRFSALPSHIEQLPTPTWEATMAMCTTRIKIRAAMRSPTNPNGTRVARQ